ncbi:glycosyltransferase [Chloroflexota bacterium]
MENIDGKRIAFFIGNSKYPVERSSSIICAVACFVKAGYFVDIFLNQTMPTELASFDKERVSIHELEQRTTTSVKRGIRAFIRVRFRSLFKITPINVKRLAYDTITVIKRLFVEEDVYLFIPKHVIETAKNIVAQRKYIDFIAFDNQGLLFASFIGSEMGVPVIYYSLEIHLSYDSTNYNFMKYKSFRILKELERKYHEVALATIIQDEERARLLLEDNRVPNSPILLVPVSLLGGRKDEKTDYLFERLNIPRKKRVILHLGATTPDMYAVEIVEAAQKLPDEWVVVLHGPIGGYNTIDKIEQADAGKKVYLSTELIPFDELQSLVSSAEVGLVFYKNLSLNEFDTGSSSGKLAHYLQCGLPVITINYPGFKKIIEEYHCGICVNHPADINSTLEQITSDYEKYKMNAFRCYEERYEFSRHFQKVVDLVENGLGKRREGKYFE